MPHLVQHLLDESGSFRVDPLDRPPRMRLAHLVGEEGPTLDRGERSFVDPVFEQFAGTPQPLVEGGGVVRSEPSEERQIVGTSDDVDRVELNHPHPGQNPAEMPDVDAPAGCRIRETLGGERQSTGAFERDARNGTGHGAGGYRGSGSGDRGNGAGAASFALHLCP